MQVEVDLAFNQDSDDAQRGTAQAERVAVAGGLLADREHTRQRIQLIGHGEELAIG